MAGRYQLEEQIGRGGMGVVWRAHDELLDRAVAVKEVRYPGDPDDDEVAELNRRTLREARAAGRLSHPNVVVVHDVIEEGGRPWIVMQLIESRSLGQVLREDGPLPVRMVAEIGLQVMEALRTAHAAGVLHRDVKPENVLLTDDGRVVLTDFGIARMETDTTMTRTGLVGTPAFIAPERLRGSPAQRESDLWSLGATLYAAVEGRPPHDKGMAMATMHAVLTDEPEPAPRAGRLGPVLLGLLEKNPARRLTADQAERLLRAIAEDRSAAPTSSMQTLPATPRPVPETSPPRRRPRQDLPSPPLPHQDDAGDDAAPAGEQDGALDRVRALRQAPGRPGKSAPKSAPATPPAGPPPSSGRAEPAEAERPASVGSPAEAAPEAARKPAPAGVFPSSGAEAADGKGVRGGEGDGGAPSPGSEGEQAPRPAPSKSSAKPAKPAKPAAGKSAGPSAPKDAEEAPPSQGSERPKAPPVTGAVAAPVQPVTPDAPGRSAGPAPYGPESREALRPTRVPRPGGRPEAETRPETRRRPYGDAGPDRAAAEEVVAPGPGVAPAPGTDRATAVRAGESSAFSGFWQTGPAREDGDDGPPRRPLPVARIVLVTLPVVLIVAGVALWLGLRDASDTPDPSASGKNAAPPATNSSAGASPSQSSSPPPSPTPSEKPKPSSTPKPDEIGPGDVPEGWRKHKHGGFSLALPKGWRVDGSGNGEIRFRGDSHTYLEVHHTSNPESDALKTWRRDVPGMSGNFPGYKLIAIREVKGFWKTAADWEFTFGDSRFRSRVIDRGFVTDKNNGYALLYKTQDKDWKKKKKLFEKLAATFKPAK
ncbi:serine/threonine-protein kinase [Sphaerisporangium siamense]|uniref:non-specific serine/threonine protein kinase n=1 Tax=Sphaerisporangium siamense TaxID=795645 RepID=A0A7W7DEX4_9ACTN|nr:serine/threonine-protein kinase [Sphaerisporangium siamense]MBB4704765.1 serine/threonine protein kinase [Sphaerisporangium siamense]